MEISKAKPSAGRRILLVVAALLLMGISGAASWFVASERHALNDETVTVISHEANKKAGTVDDSIRLIATGDMLAHDSVNTNAKTATGYDYTRFFVSVKEFTSNGDIRFCNQEGLSAGEAYGISGYPTFNAPKEFSRDLSAIGCNTINLANNHMADKGRAVIGETLKTWQDLKPLAVSGANRSVAERDTVHYIETKGIKVAFLTFNEINNNRGAADYSITMLNEPIVTKLMAEARANADFVMVSVHWGNYEDSTQVGPLEETWAKRLSALGADVIIGTGPHVLQRAEWQTGMDGRKVLVWYSLGNFLSTQYELLAQRIGGIAVMKLEKTNDKKIPVKISKVGFMPTYMHYDWPPADRAAEELTTRTNLGVHPLNKADGPLGRSGFTTTVREQQEIVRTTLGPDVTMLTSGTMNRF